MTNNEVISYEQLQDFSLKNDKVDTVSDIKQIIAALLDRKKLDMITSVKETEIDNITNKLHHGIQYSRMMNRHLGFLDENNKKVDKDTQLEMCSPHHHVIQNLALRLSLDRESRKEFVKVSTAMIQRTQDIENEQRRRERQEEESQETK